MIVYDLRCDAGHQFEGWFASAASFDDQAKRTLLACAICGSSAVSKAVMAPRLAPHGAIEPAHTGQDLARRDLGHQTLEGASADRQPVPAMTESLHRKLAAMQARALEGSAWVGDGFANEARAMHYGDKAQRAIHGRATLTDAKSLVDEGISLAPLPLPVAPPDEIH